MPRIGVNISQDLFARAQPYRNRFNISKICRDAVEAEVAKHEKAAKAVEEDNVEATVDRLVQEYQMQEVGPDWAASGYEDAKTWIELAPLEDFRTLAYRLSLKRRLDTAIVPHVEGAPLFVDREHEHKEWFIDNVEKDGVHVNVREKVSKLYHDAWFSYAQTIIDKFNARILEITDTDLKKQAEE